MQMSNQGIPGHWEGDHHAQKLLWEPPSWWSFLSSLWSCSLLARKLWSGHQYPCSCQACWWWGHTKEELTTSFWLDSPLCLHFLPLSLLPAGHAFFKAFPFLVVFLFWHFLLCHFVVLLQLSLCGPTEHETWWCQESRVRFEKMLDQGSTRRFVNSTTFT